MIGSITSGSEEPGDGGADVVDFREDCASEEDVPDGGEPRRHGRHGVGHGTVVVDHHPLSDDGVTPASAPRHSDGRA